eukprot:CAMPEP_0182550186 /NCGR_PEP_ID=MMETSP1323-20130603/41295_1 /TAXON_ID=236787 /ORGANISM="Florenciella parvula, Strain RCC1693" /LENGTH=39 /DNA_ID= /DNA_START= /DNA_END= /DNA_ORIENTATION=
MSMGKNCELISCLTSFMSYSFAVVGFFDSADAMPEIGDP